MSCVILFANLNFILHRSLLTSYNALTCQDLPFYRFIYEYLYSQSRPAVCQCVCLYVPVFILFIEYMYS